MADIDTPECKKTKLVETPEKYNVSTGECVSSIHETLHDLSSFKFKTVLNNNTAHKVLCLLGTFDNRDGEALAILEKSAFSEENLTDKDLFAKENLLEKVFHNDIYGSYSYFPTSKLNKIKATIIYPATQKHIAKYSAQEIFIVEETPRLYQDIVLPQILEESLTLKWVYNILQHKSESESIVFEDRDPDNGFVLLPDLKWNGNVDTLYLLAISHKCDIKSLRDLNATHLPLLKNILTSGRKTIESKYGLGEHLLRIYVHYQPSFYHFHVHFTNLRHEAPGILVERAHLLSTIIDNLELMSNYYEKCTLPFTVRKEDKLYEKLRKANAI